MKLYYHKTDGGAEYYCLTHVDGCDEGDIRSAVIRTDGDVFEAYDDVILQHYNKFTQKYHSPHSLNPHDHLAM